jgi:hypothetical protein
MNNHDLLLRRIFGFTLAAQFGMAIAGISYAIGHKVGFGAFILTDEVLNSIIGYDNVMNAFLWSAIWQINSFMLMLLGAKWFIYQDKSKKLWFSLLIYLIMPFIVWFSLAGHARFIGFSLIAAVATYEGLIHAWVVDPPLRKT